MKSPTLFCRRCKTRKPRQQFASGAKRQSHICAKCLRQEARKGRRCTSCGLVKVLDEFPLTGTKRGTGRAYRNRECNVCRGAYKAEHHQRGNRNAKVMAKRKASQKRWRTNNRERAAAAARRYRARRKADPRRHAEHLEHRRIAYALKREREGKPVRWHTSKAAKAPSRSPKRVPTAPMVAFIDGLIERRRAVENLIAENRGAMNSVVADVCRDLGITDRTLRRWRKESNLSVALAEKVLLAAEVDWHEVYSYDDHRAAFLAEPIEVRS